MPVIQIHGQPLVPSTERRGGEDIPDWAARGVEIIERYGATIFRIGALRLAEEPSRRMAHEIVDAAHKRLIAAGLPTDSSLEHDHVQSSAVQEGASTRTLLPHHDGGHTSFLTPSAHHDPQWPPEHRTFSTSGFTTTAAHKVYHGVFLPEPGQGLSVTTYYPFVDIIADAYAYQQGKRAPDVATLACWLGNNLRGAVDRSTEHNCPYPALSGFLGLVWPDVEAVGIHYADVDVAGEVPEAVAGRAANCPCGKCAGQTTRLICHITDAALGLTWPVFRDRYERWACTERFDLVIGHNLTMLHGGLCGGTGRTIEPMCLIVDEPSGRAYETWLARSWESAHGTA
jgi:hypothetical protein